MKLEPNTTVLPRLGNDGRILEGVLTTLHADGRLHLAPMGPIVSDPIDRMILRPFRTSTSYANLARDHCGVFHVVDDALLIARSAIGRCKPRPETRPASAVRGRILTDACRWYAFRVNEIDASNDRAEVVAEVVDRGEQRPFFGFNRAKHAVVEAAILASRVHLLPVEAIQQELLRLRTPVQKTGGADELCAFRLLVEFVGSQTSDSLNDRLFGEAD